ncbi:MAG: tetratricopeptide repeat protein [Myxococcaceae bacterium]
MNPTTQVSIDVEQLPVSLKRFLQGEWTWAQVEGMTEAQAREIAELGCQLAASGRLREAQTLFEGLVAGNPKDAAAQAALGTVLQRQGNTDLAKRAYEEALKHDPGQVVALCNRGELRLYARDAGGIADLMEAMKSDPQEGTASGKRARALLEVVNAWHADGRIRADATAHGTM